MTTQTTPLMTPDEVVDIRRQAALLLQERGWTQGVMEDRDGQVCMYGAIAAVTGEFDEVRWERHRANCVAAHMFPEGQGRGPTPGPVVAMAEWNDRAGRTVDDVIARLKGETSE